MQYRLSRPLRLEPVVRILLESRDVQDPELGVNVLRKRWLALVIEAYRVMIGERYNCHVDSVFR